MHLSNDTLFFENTGLSKEKALSITQDSLHGAEDGELFLEYTYSESFSLEDSRIKSATYDITQGFGLRSVIGEITAYAHASDISEEALTRASKTVKSIIKSKGGVLATGPQKTNQKLYTDINPLSVQPFEQKVRLLSEIDMYGRSKDPRIKQILASLAGEWQMVTILRPDGNCIQDIRPLVRLNIAVVAEENGRTEIANYGGGGRLLYDAFFDPSHWKNYTDEAIRVALLNLQARPAPAGEMPVVLGAGWPGVLLHEAVGHGLEGDFNRKKTSAFSDLMGKRVASPGVTVIDDGTIPDRRGSLNIDDEGTPTEHTVLIEDGILVGYMQDRLNARLMGMKPTGNGRRESFASPPMPRMTNTYMLGGTHTLDEMIQSVPKGIYAANFSGGQVDITSGNFVFSMSEAYLIENGKITTPLKGATLIGSGPETMQKVTMIGNDMKLDSGVGTCGKEGQSVPVGVGQPSLLISSMTVGGTSF